MNIVYATRAAIPYPSAASINTMQMCQSLAAMGHSVTLAIGRKIWRRPCTSSAIWSYYGVAPCFDVRRFLELPKMGRFYDDGVVRLCREHNSLLYARYPRVLPAAIRGQVRTVLEVHSKLSPRQLRIVARSFQSKDFLGLIVITNVLRHQLLNHLHRYRDKIHVAPDAVNVNRFHTRIDGSNRNTTVGYVGGLFPGKGMEIISPVASQLPDTLFHIYGGRKRDIARWRRVSTDTENLRFMGAVAPRHIPDCMSRFKIALLPNQPRVLIPSGDDIGRYTSPLKLFEYMAAGKAIIASDLPNLREVLQDEHNCLLVPHDEPLAWVTAIGRLQSDLGLSERLGHQARQDAVTHYSYETRFRRVFQHLALKCPHSDAA